MGSFVILEKGESFPIQLIVGHYTDMMAIIDGTHTLRMVCFNG